MATTPSFGASIGVLSMWEVLLTVDGNHLFRQPLRSSAWCSGAVKYTPKDLSVETAQGNSVLLIQHSTIISESQLLCHVSTIGHEHTVLQKQWAKSTGVCARGRRRACTCMQACRKKQNCAPLLCPPTLVISPLNAPKRPEKKVAVQSSRSHFSIEHLETTADN